MDGTVGAARKVFAGAVTPQHRRGGQMPVLAAGAIVAAIALALLTNPRASLSIVLAGGVGLVGVAAAFVYTAHHREAVIIALLLTKMLSANFLMPAGVSTA